MARSIVATALAVVITVSTAASIANAAVQSASTPTESTVWFDLNTTVATNLNGVFEVTLDIGTLTDGTVCNLSDPKIINLISAMRYSYIRVGGTEADFTHYALNDTSRHFPMPAPPKPFTRTLSGGMWDWFMTFAQTVGAKVLFGLNAGPPVRTPEGAWTSEMAAQMVAHNAEKFPGVMGGYEFGNEPDLYPLNFPGVFPNGTQWARDMQLVRTLLNLYDPGLLTVCCDVMYTPLLGSLLPIEKEFVAAGGLEWTNITTWHYYPLFGKPMDRFLPQWIDPYFATPERLAMPLTLNEAHKWATHASDDAGPTAQVWLGETASASFGGQVNVSDSWVDSMAAVDKAGLITRLGQQRAFRQEICADHWTSANQTTTNSAPYTLLDRDHNPRPTFYVMWLFRQLVGDRAFASQSSPEYAGVRAYAYAARAGVHATPAGASGRSVVFTFVNPDNNTRSDLNMCFHTGSTQPASGSVAAVYAVGACNGELTGKSVCINGAEMTADSEGHLAPLPAPTGMPLLQQPGSGCFALPVSAVMAPHSVWFLVVDL